MSRPIRRRLRAGAVTAATAVTAGLLAGALALPAGAAPRHAPAVQHHRYPGMAPVAPGSDYLALGDSVAFGYRESDTTPAPNYGDPAQFVGYPEDVAAALDLHVVNLACPGETSASLINPSAPSNGCEISYDPTTHREDLPGYRTGYQLHVSYTGSQLVAGVVYLRRHPDTRLVTLMIGANDGFLCQEETADHCTSAAELGAVSSRITANVAKILYAVRDNAHYRGQIVLVPYYSVDYATPADNESSRLINAAMKAGAKGYGVEVAPSYTAFMDASRYSGDDPCTAGLLTQLATSGKPTGSCGVHPSPAGQDVLAQAVEETVVK